MHLTRTGMPRLTEGLPAVHHYDDPITGDVVCVIASDGPRRRRACLRFSFMELARTDFIGSDPERRFAGAWAWCLADRSRRWPPEADQAAYERVLRGQQ